MNTDSAKSHWIKPVVETLKTALTESTCTNGDNGKFSSGADGLCDNIQSWLSFWVSLVCFFYFLSNQANLAWFIDLY